MLGTGFASASSRLCQWFWATHKISQGGIQRALKLEGAPLLVQSKFCRGHFGSCSFPMRWECAYDCITKKNPIFLSFSGTVILNKQVHFLKVYIHLLYFVLIPCLYKRVAISG